MRKAFKGVFFILFLVNFFYANGIDNLSGKVSRGIRDFFNGKYNINISIVKFDNYSGLSNLAAQTYYQLLVSKLESDKNINFIDLMIDLNKNRGEFNLTRKNELNYLIYIKLIRNKNKIGVGTVIFSKSVDKIVYIKYFENIISKNEKDLLNIANYGFKGSAFCKLAELDSEMNLFDIKTIGDTKGEYRCFFLYPKKILIYKLKGNNLDKILSIKLKWVRPFYPTLEPEGKLSLFYFKKVLYLSAGNNFSPVSKFFMLHEDRWEELTDLDFVPFRIVELNGNYYIAGSNYEYGMNYFDGKIVLAPFSSEKVDLENKLEKRVPLFYSIDFSTIKDRLDSVHIIDKNYNYRFYSADFIEQSVEKEKRGSSLCSVSGKWLAVSDYSKLTDKLFFYKIENGSKKLIYETNIKGEIIFISSGFMKKKDGFWIYTKVKKNYGKEFKLQFWSKSNE